MEEADRSLATPGQQLVLSLEDASLLILERSAIRPACEAAQAAISATHGQVIDEVDRAESQRVHARIQLSASVFYELDPGTAANVRDALPGIADILERAGRIDESLAARLTHAERLHEAANAVEALNSLVARAQTLDQPKLRGRHRCDSVPGSRRRELQQSRSIMLSPGPPSIIKMHNTSTERSPSVMREHFWRSSVNSLLPKSYFQSATTI